MFVVYVLQRLTLMIVLVGRQIVITGWWTLNRWWEVELCTASSHNTCLYTGGRVVHLNVEECSESVAKEPARSKQNTPLGIFCVPKPLVGGFGCDELVLYGVSSRPMRAEPRHSSTNESGPHWLCTPEGRQPGRLKILITNRDNCLTWSWSSPDASFYLRSGQPTLKTWVPQVHTTVKKDCDSSIPSVSVQYPGLISQAVTLMSCPVDFGTLIKSYYSCSSIVTDISNSSMHHQNIRYLLTYFYNINQFNYITISEWSELTVCKLKGYNNWGLDCGAVLIKLEKSPGKQGGSGSELMQGLWSPSPSPSLLTSLHKHWQFLGKFGQQLTFLEVTVK